MAADKLGRYLTSPEFRARANAAIAKAIRELEAKGIQPVYINRKSRGVVGSSSDVSRESDAHEGPAGADTSETGVENRG
ncbi:hypothetical protein G3N57_13400 [Paraburkholderia sp. Se-20369]|nr:hypothetical protein [Paraburkholderia sp. Se-20369]